MGLLMPSSPGYVRDYKQEQQYDGRPSVKKKRAKRNAARREMIRQGKAAKGDGKDVDHKNGNTKDNSKSNLRVVSASKNRSYPRTKSAGKKK
jgi:hypothetical protein